MATEQQTDGSLGRAAVYHGAQVVPDVRPIAVRPALVSFPPAVLVWPWPANLIADRTNMVRLAVRLLGDRAGPAEPPWLVPSRVEVFPLPSQDDSSDGTLLGVILLADRYEDEPLFPLPNGSPDELRRWIRQESTWPDVLAQIDSRLGDALRPAAAARASTAQAGTTAVPEAAQVEVAYTRYAADTDRLDDLICQIFFGD
jgi:hypothetical protein